MRSKPTPRNSRRYKKSHKYREPDGHAEADGGVINLQQMKAVAEFFKNGGDQKAALLAAGYSKNTANHCSHSVFSHPAVKREIDRRKRLMMEKAEINEEWVLRKLAKIANGPEILARFRKVGPDGLLYYDFEGATEEEIAVITEMTVDTYMDGRDEDAREVKKMKIGSGDPKAALDSIARILGLNQDRVKHEGEVSIVERLHAGRRRLNQETEEGKA